jgi:DnaK suppressor protein
MKRNATARGSAGGYRRRLQEKRTDVLFGLGVRFDTLARMGRVAEDDQAQISHDEFVSLSRNSMDYDLLRLVEEALDRLHTGDYGVCLACEQPIPAKRLEALPWARYCVACQERLSSAGDAMPPPGFGPWN